MPKKPIFRVVDSHKYSKLGLRRKKKVVYRRPRGGENKIRLNMKGKLRKVKVGFKNNRKERGLIKKNGFKKIPVLIYNVGDLKKIKENNIGIITNIGNKKKKEISEYVLKNKENKIYLLNLNPKKFLKNMENKMRKTKEGKDTREKKKEFRENEIKAKEQKTEEKKEGKIEKNTEKLEEKLENENKEKTELNVNEMEIKDE